MGKDKKEKAAAAEAADAGAGEASYEAKSKFCSVIAKPLADEKLCKKVLKLAKKASKRKQIRRGVKEVVKALRKNAKGWVLGQAPGAGVHDFWRNRYRLRRAMHGATIMHGCHHDGMHHPQHVRGGRVGAACDHLAPTLPWPQASAARWDTLFPPTYARTVPQWPHAPWPVRYCCTQRLLVSARKHTLRVYSPSARDRTPSLTLAMRAPPPAGYASWRETSPPSTC
jgi:hypothetical protein